MKLRRVLYHTLLISLLVLSGCTGVFSRQPKAADETLKTTREICHDILGGQQPNFKYKSAGKYFSPNSCLGYLDTTFSTSLTSPSYLLNKLQPSFLRVHFLNTVCVRNQNCGNYEPLAGYSIASLNATLESSNNPKKTKILNYLEGRVKEWRKLSDANPGTYIIASPALEHNLSFKAYRVLADATLKAWPGVQLGNSGMGGVSTEAYRGAWIERHGQKDIGKEINSLDGEDVTDINVESWLKATDGNVLTFRWTRSYNCRTQSLTFLDPRKRTACPKNYQFEEIEHVTDKLPPAPAKQFAGSCKPFDQSNIWKPMSEDKGTGDPRANKPVVISKLGNGTVTLLSFKGQEVGKLTYYGKFTDGRDRHYSCHRGGSCKGGYQFQKIAVKLSGSPYVWAKSGSKCVGPFAPGRRQGDYR